VDVQVVGVRATAGMDFQAPSQTLTFPPGVISQAVTLEIKGDLIYEGDEDFELHLSNAVGGDLIVTEAVITIDDNEALPSLAVAPAGNG
jgi:hypothetical protein